MVGAHHWQSVATALDAGQVVAVPGDGAYQLAVLPAHRAAMTALARRAPNPVGGGPLGFVVGRHAQAMELAPGWSKETSILTDRMWPGPLVVMVTVGANIVSISMPASRPLRALSRATGPLVTMAPRRADGEPMRDPDDVGTSFSGDDVACVLDGGTCRGAGPTVVDCTRSPPEVRHVGALPESYVDAALMMGNRRRTWFKKRDDPERR
jgi:tRNA A37 threonylcarbamoyladenosine synthetase subunit TsaC/SUA5/YrdC